MFKNSRQSKIINDLQLRLRDIEERSDLLDSTSGIGLWQAILHNADAMDPHSLWTWSPEFVRLVGYTGEADFPNVVQSWSDKLHPDDVAATFAAFGAHLSDKTGRARYDVTYRLKTRDGSYRWFRATGGCRHSADGSTIRACGSLTDIHEQKLTELNTAKETEHDAHAISALGAAMRALAQGDLSYRIESEFAPKTQQLKEDFNAAIAGLEQAMQSISGTTSSIHTGSEEIAHAADDLSRRTEQQAASLEETAAAVDEITATVHKTAQGAQQARTVVSTAKSDAERGGKVASQAIDAVNGIEKSSEQIGQIIGVIDEIAFQTNLLALNAGVEAARAGEAGRGFAVVASEVRALAQRSAEAAKEIKALITASRSQVEQGVDLVTETGKALERIFAQVAEIDTVVSDIASSAQEQATGLQEVNTAVNQMDQVTQQNAAMVEETTAASHALAREAQELAALVNRFRVKRSEAVGRTTAPPRRAAKPVAVAAAPRPALKTTAPRGGGAAPKPAADEWEEF
jgi:methyl-accepting chemotaxis protein